MCHGHDDFADALIAGFFEREVQQWNEAFRTFEGEGFGADKFFANEFLERDRVGKPGENAELFIAGELDAVLGGLHAALQPAANTEVVDVHVLDADGAAVGVAEALK